MFRLWKMFLIFLLLTFSASGVESAIHALSMSRAIGRLLSSHSLHQSPVRGLTDCVQLCLRHFDDCSSIAYDEDSQMCDVFASVAGYPQLTLVFTARVLLYMKYQEVLRTYCGCNDVLPYTTSEVSTKTYRDCTDVKKRLSCESGVYQIQPCTSCDAFLAYCDMDTDCEAWTVFQRRQDGSVDFNQNWQNYASGFGDLSGEFWLGNKKIHEITSSAKYEFRIDMVATDDSAYHVTYESIEIGSEAENVRLDLGEYINAKSTAGNGLGYTNDRYNLGLNGMNFSTIDRDNDNYGSSCSIFYKSGWWFNACCHSNLNGEYTSSIHWYDGISNYILRFSEMKMRRVV